MDVGAWLVWGFASTLLLSSVLAASQALRFTRMNIPFMLGTMFTMNRDRAHLVGIMFHLMNGWLFALIYIAAFHQRGEATWWFGAGIGLAHAITVLAVFMPVLPAMHRNMASETEGPTLRAQLEPPGFFGLNYGIQTPIAALLAHIGYGALLGVLYTVA